MGNLTQLEIYFKFAKYIGCVLGILNLFLIWHINLLLIILETGLKPIFDETKEQLQKWQSNVLILMFMF